MMCWARALGAAHVEAHQPLEAGIDVAFCQQLAVFGQHVGRRKRFFRGNTLVCGVCHAVS
jgi:hypothetical protein